MQILEHHFTVWMYSKILSLVQFVFCFQLMNYEDENRGWASGASQKANKQKYTKEAMMSDPYVRCLKT